MDAQTQQQMTSNQNFLNPNIIQIRLDTSELIQRLKEFLSGQVVIPERQADGTTKFITQELGEHLCNSRGVAHLTNYISGLINPAVVQGNYEQHQYYNHVSRVHKTISRQLVVNYHTWGMKYDDLEMINDYIMNLIETFLSRLIENKERESYSQTLRSTESNTVESGGGLSNLFGGK